MRTIVVKYGGAAMGDVAAFAADVHRLADAGDRVVVVHGGGPQVSALLHRLGIPSEFAGGLRVTTDEVLDVVRMVLAGKVGKDLVTALGPRAVGLSGEDGETLVAAPLDPALGRVGDIVRVDASLLETLLAAGRIPVLATVARGVAGGALNVNADTAAAAVAVALRAGELLVLTDVAGLYDATGAVVPSLDATALRAMLPALSGGMAPKMAACLRAVLGGVATVRVRDGRGARPLTGAGSGTVVTA